jgi:hypothetical protein
MKTTTLALSLILGAHLLSAAETAAPGVKSSYEVVQSPVLKVYTAKEGKHKFVAYVVKWKDMEVIVSDPLARSECKVGDTISFLAQKTSVEQGSTTTDSLSFTLTHAPPR